MLADECGFSVVNGDDIFREMAKDQKMTVAEIATVAEDDFCIDREIDDRLLNFPVMISMTVVQRG
ncbi:hypothetical protein A4G99_16690 [Haladaptatus sp. R4]|nr:hypothetical protein A4G99_16690 [Haladaptatus sp. R4]